MNGRPAVFFRKSSQQGFTLIELMVTVVIIAILASIAMPTYNNYVIKGKIPDATSALATKRMAMEQFFQDNHTYAGANGANLPCANDGTTSRYFTFACNLPAGGLSYNIIATGQGSMAGFTYTIDNNNVKGTAIASPPAPNNWIGGACWVTKPGGC